MYYFEIFEALYLKKVRYLIVGGLAVNLYGVPRITQDIDIIVSMDDDNIVKLNTVLKKLGYVPRLPINPYDLSNDKVRQTWINEKNLKAFSFYNKKENFKVIDVIISHPLDFERAYQSKVVKKVKYFDIYLVSIDDLINMKKVTERDQDLSDIEMLIKVKKWMEEEKD
ncbi:MAG TPA: DUF6036 family nucleotidyltransferase [Candidatus Lokiarchaeia archaeon]